MICAEGVEDGVYGRRGGFLVVEYCEGGEGEEENEEGEGFQPEV